MSTADSESRIAQMRADGGAAGFVDIVARLLTATFGAGEAAKQAEAGLPGKFPQAARDPL